jgi:type II secretory pathway component PulF
MLRDGIPLEGALHQLCGSMKRGQLRAEMEILEADLKRGVPLKDAIASRRFPEFYVQMVQVGVAANDLSGVLLMLADYYNRSNAVWTRLKGLMVYPLMVLIAAFMLSCFFTVLCTTGVYTTFPEGLGMSIPPGILASLWCPPILLGLTLAIVLVILAVPSMNRSLRWRVPAFRDAKLAQVASAMRLMLAAGGNLNVSLGIAEKLEAGTPAGRELALWKSRMSDGKGKFAQMALPGRAFPPLFVWLVANSGEDLAAGFRRAAEIYGTRAIQRVEMFLFAALPFSIMALGTMIICQVLPMVHLFTSFMNSLGSVD